MVLIAEKWANEISDRYLRSQHQKNIAPAIRANTFVVVDLACGGARRCPCKGIAALSFGGEVSHTLKARSIQCRSNISLIFEDPLFGYLQIVILSELDQRRRLAQNPAHRRLSGRLLPTGPGTIWSAFGKLVWPISAVCFGPPLGR
jgi:hypothetical protein